jgi:hypothetical protein
MRIAGLLLAIVLVLGPGSGSAQTVEVRGELGASLRAFPEEALFPGQTDARLSPSFVLTPEILVESEGGYWLLEGQGFARLDAHDGNRSHVDVREFGLTYLGDRFTGFVGFGQAFWGVTEVRHLVDIVNQVDGVEDLDGEDRLGQPMASLTLEGAWGAMDLYLLPYFRERTFPQADARLGGPLPMAESAIYTSGQGRWSPDIAGRFFKTVGSLDFGLSAFNGTSREPRLTPSVSVAGAPVLQAEYDAIDQVGLDAQWTGERTLLKLEVMTRGGHGERLYAVSGGIENTLYQVLGSDGDLGLLAEVMYDSRGSGAPATIFENDVFVGGRWALNDVSDTSVLGGPLIDLDTGEALILVEAVPFRVAVLLIGRRRRRGHLPGPRASSQPDAIHRLVQRRAWSRHGRAGAVRRERAHTSHWRCPPARAHGGGVVDAGTAPGCRCRDARRVGRWEVDHPEALGAEPRPSICLPPRTPSAS